ncbi:MAG: L,D-transpeptidase family protein [Desulfovibrio sp.]|nr:L,D-transpeptidase family protein [Desulfovibrio sp.]
MIADHPANPAYLFVVDKSRQKLAFFEKHSPFRLSKVFICTTGQKPGDKEVEKDLKTPEGIYFVVRHIEGGLDFTKFGPEAFTLNYPNPVDRLRGKTGFGIWVHGRGEPLVPLQTEGCVALHNDDLTVLRKLLAPGTPVALTQTFSMKAEEARAEISEVRRLEQKVKDWAEAWSDRNRKYFDFYEQDSYSRAQGESFAAFRENKERLFKMLPWIRTSVSDIQILRGPGYWVSWFFQDYKAPNLSTRGIRRLYWDKNAQGEFKIIGMEWEPGLESALVASASPFLPPLQGSAAQDVASQLDAEWKPAPLVLPGKMGQKVELVAAAQPESKSQDADGVPMAFKPVPDTVVEGGPSRSGDRANPAAQSVGMQTRGKSSPDHVEDPTFGAMARPAPEAFLLAERMRLSARNTETASSSAGERSGKASVVSMEGQNLSLPPALPAQGLGASLAPRVADPAADAVSEPGRASENEDMLSAQVSTGAQAGKKGQALQTKARGRGESGFAALVEAVTEQVKGWRNAWESGNLDDYTAFYAPNAQQGAHTGQKSIRRHKEKLWSKAAPAEVRLSDIRMRVHGDKVIADMNQLYADKTGRGDNGLKTLTFEYMNGAWRITREEWSAFEAGN